MQAFSISFAFLSTRAVRLKYSLLSSFFLAHSSLITALWLATSLARNLLSPSVIILILFLVNNRSRTRYVPRRFWLLVTARNTMRATMFFAAHQSVKAAPYTSLCDYIPLSLYSVSVDYFYCFHNSNMFWLIAGSTLSYCPVLARDCTPDFLKHTES